MHYINSFLMLFTTFNAAQVTDVNLHKACVSVT